MVMEVGEVAEEGCGDDLEGLSCEWFFAVFSGVFLTWWCLWLVVIVERCGFDEHGK